MYCLFVCLFFSSSSDIHITFSIHNIRNRYLYLHNQCTISILFIQNSHKLRLGGSLCCFCCCLFLIYIVFLFIFIITFSVASCCSLFLFSSRLILRFAKNNSFACERLASEETTTCWLCTWICWYCGYSSVCGCCLERIYIYFEWG